MSVYKLFPQKSATIYSSYPNMNTGIDEILESTLKLYSRTENTPQTSRFLLQFSNDEINSVFTNYINTYNTWSVSLNCHAAELKDVNIDTTLECFPLSGSWGQGTGKYLNIPETTNGVSWIWRTYSGSNQWSTSSFSSNVTASFNISGTYGGGTWYTGSPNFSIINSNTNPISASQIFNTNVSDDINIDVTNIIKAWVSGAFDNDGFIIKQKEEFIDNINYIPSFKYFSSNTNTIYPPSLNIKWKDYNSVLTGSLTSSIINSPDSNISISENPGIFYTSSINKFRVNARPMYPTRTFATSSEYSINYYLPTSSYYAVKDLYTNEYVIDFDDIYTQISSDSTSSYFNLYMNGLQPERYYCIQIKTIIDGSTLIYDDNYYFKIVNG